MRWWERKNQRVTLFSGSENMSDPYTPKSSKLGMLLWSREQGFFQSACGMKYV